MIGVDSSLTSYVLAPNGTFTTTTDTVMVSQVHASLIKPSSIPPSAHSLSFPYPSTMFHLSFRLKVTQLMPTLTWLLQWVEHRGP